MNETCTVRNAVTGPCGRPAVYAWTSAVTGERFAECREHFQGIEHATVRDGYQVGDRVTVQRNGRTYDATVTRIGSRGAVYATFTYNNGATRTVRV